MSARLICLLVATVLFVVAALLAYAPNPPRVNLTAAGLAFLAASFLAP